ncbi:hypothetical protein B7463_g6516, partial [Scytalidium lignicola]
MPLINGLKMACEPCIRGHRSTKCTHANERLMVPVRKPGRPLSACPHPRDQACSCGRLSVTAAIPKKQKCRCGDDTPTEVEKSPQADQPSNSAPADLPSPNRTTFKVQKNTRPVSNRKQSFDASKLQRMDINNINILPFEQTLQSVSAQPNSGVSASAPPQQFGYTPQFINIEPSYGHMMLQNFPQAHNFIANNVAMDVRNGLSSTSLVYGNLSSMIENPLLTKSNGLSNGSADQRSKGGSCCAPKVVSITDTSPNANVIPLPEEPKERSCCSSTPAPGQMVIKQESIEAQNTPNGMVQHIPLQFSHDGNGQSNVLPQYLTQSVFAYPPTYGSYQHPLQPFQWRQTAKANIEPQAQGQATSPLEPPFNGPLLQNEILDSFHTCHCGDGCQCIGCAAHPYNEATQNYVRSAYSSMLLEPTSSSKELYINGNSSTNGHTNNQSPANGNGFSPTSPTYTNGQSQIKDTIPSPPAPQTPGSKTQSPTPYEEQTLNASDFFFVSYPFASDSCSGDTVSCPCGDDCQCLGCTIHRGSPSMPCPGDKDECPCGDECECVGCTIHNVAGPRL